MRTAWITQSNPYLRSGSGLVGEHIEDSGILHKKQGVVCQYVNFLMGRIEELMPCLMRDGPTVRVDGLDLFGPGSRNSDSMDLWP
jgi:hypothetical protein